MSKWLDKFSETPKSASAEPGATGANVMNKPAAITSAPIRPQLENLYPASLDADSSRKFARQVRMLPQTDQVQFWIKFAQWMATFQNHEWATTVFNQIAGDFGDEDCQPA